MSQAAGGTGAGLSGGGGPSGVTDQPRRKYKKGDRTRRIWSHREEEILAATLVELVALDWKSDNGFRTGYLQKCEDSIWQEFPTSDIKGQPHIVSKITAWKTSYTSLRNIFERTGVGFSSNGDYKIDIDDDQWEHVVKVDPKAKFMRHKSWPLWETWKCIFGKDRATGGGAENISVAAARLRNSGGGGSECDDSDSQPPFVVVPFGNTKPADEENVTEQLSLGNTDKQPILSKSVGEKRKAASSDQLLMDFLANLHDETNSRLAELSAKIGYDFDLGQARQAVFDKLGEVDGISIAQKYRLRNILCDKPQRLEVFMGMPAQARLGYLLSLLEDV